MIDDNLNLDVLGLNSCICKDEMRQFKVCTMNQIRSEELLLFGSSFLGSWLLLRGDLLLRGSLLGLWLLHLLHLLSLNLLRLLSLNLLGLLWCLCELDGAIDSLSCLSAAGNQSFGCQHLLDGPPHVALDLLGVVANLVLGHDVLEDGFARGASLLGEGNDGGGDHVGCGGVGGLHGGLLGLGDFSGCGGGHFGGFVKIGVDAMEG